MPAGISNASLASGAQPLAGKTILYDSGQAVGATTDAIRTVTAGKTYYLLAMFLDLSGNVDATGGGLARIYIAPSSDLLALRLAITATYKITDSQHSEWVTPYPIPIAAGKVINVICGAANCTATAHIVGWEE